jgi:DNA repair protein RecN (Recombination protein N)
MLLELRIGNLALAQDVSLRPGTGLTVLTGETGAGKSLVAGALDLLAGGKADRQMVRQGEEEAWVEAVCDLSDRPDLRTSLRRLGIVVGDDGVLVLRRELRREARGRVLIDGRLSSLSVLREAGEQLFAIQSQDQKRELAATGFARDLLDDALDLGAQRQDVADALAAHREAVETLARRQREQAQAEEQLDIWRYQLEELRGAALRMDEEAELAEAIALKRHAHGMLEAAALASDLLDTGAAPAREAIGRAESCLAAHVEHSPRLADAHARLADAAEAVADAVTELSRFRDGFADDPRDLDELSARKSLYEELRRKYRRDLPALLALADDLAARIERHDAAAGDLDALADGVRATRERLTAACATLGDARRQGAARVSTAAEALIRPLALPEMQLRWAIDLEAAEDGEVELAGRTCRVAPHGTDRVRLLVRTNPGEAEGEVAAIASGGEAARIHLGLTMLRQRRRQPLVWLFDEVDAGLGMDAASPVALLLRELSARAQTVCITHLPTVAVHGQHHWRVVKRVEGGRTVVELGELAGDDRVGEIARQLGGEGWRHGDAAAQTAYARELLAAATAPGRMARS